MYCIYKATNKINGKSYIGKTKDFPKRKASHISGREDHLFSRAIQEYGASNFDWEILEDNIIDSDVADEREKYWIAKHNTYFRSKNSTGYNMTKGGPGATYWNIKKVACYDKHGNLKKVYDSVTDFCKDNNVKNTNQVSSAAKREGACHGYIVRYIDSDIVPAKISPYIRKGNGKDRRICQLTLEGELVKVYNKITDAEKEGFARSGILGCIKGRYKKSRGFLWCYIEDLDKNIGVRVKPVESYKSDYILKVTLDGVVLGEYESCAEAARQNGNVNYKNIHKAVNSDGHKAYGYLWSKKSQFDMGIPR